MGVTKGDVYTNYSNWYDSSGSYYDRFHLNWSRSSTSGTISTLTVTVYMDGTSTGRNISNTSITLTANSGCTVATASSSFGSTATQSIPAGWYYSAGTQVPQNTTYTFRVNQTGTTEPSITFAINGTIGSTLVTGDDSYSLPLLITNCGAPTTVSASGFVTPSGSFTVSWSGATSGTNNSISGYTIYWRVSSNGAAPGTTSGTYTGTKTVSSTSTSGSTSITLSSATRGYKVVCGVVTRGSAGVSYYSSIKTGGSVQVNRLPSKPTVTADKSQIKMYETAKITATAGSDSDSGQSIVVRYSTSSSSPSVSNTSAYSSAITVSSAATYYFWSYDGLEFSGQYTSIQITQDSNTSLSIASTNATSYSAIGGSDYLSSLQVTLSATNLKKTGNTLTTVVKYGTSATQLTNTATYTTESINGSGNNATSITKTIDSEAVIKSLGINSNNGLYFKFEFTVNNSVKTSSSVTTSGDAYKFAPIPTITTYNQFDNENIGEGTEGIFYDKIRIVFDHDQKLFNYTFSSDYSFTTNIQISNNKVTADLSFNTIPAGNSNVQINVVQTGVNGLARTFSCSMTEVKAPSLGVPNFSISTIMPFTDNRLASLNITWPFGSSTVSDYKSDYKLPTNPFRVLIRCNGITVEKENFTWSKDGDLLKTSCDTSTLYDFANNDFNLNYTGTYSFEIMIQITNVFGGNYVSSPSSTKSFNFDEIPTSISIGAITYSGSSTGGETVSGTLQSTDKMQEGLTLTFPVTAQIYTYDTYTIQLKLSLDNGTTWNNTTTTIQVTDGATNRTSKAVTTNLVYGPIGEISTTANWKWQVTITSIRNSTLTNTYSSTSYGVIRQTDPTIQLNTCTVSETEFTYNYTQSDSGVSGTLTKYLSDGTTDYTGELGAAGADRTITIKSGVTVPEISNIAIRIVSTTSGGLLTNTKVYYSNYILVYQISPTVAYRKNSLGINTASPTSGTVLDIHGQSGKDTIKILGVKSVDGQLQYTNWILALSDGIIQITNNGTINLKDCTLN